MALLSRKADYALIILSYLHHQSEGGCARIIAERFGLKKAFTANVLKALCHNGLVRSQRGLHGGYVLARAAKEIILGELLELLGEPFRLAECNSAMSHRGDGTEAKNAPQMCSLSGVCPVREAITEVDRRIRQVLSTVTLADLVLSPEGSCTRYSLEVLSGVQG